MPAYTTEQHILVKKVLSAKSHYDVLGVSRNERIDVTILKKTYKTMALQLHPDKNTAPGAKEAFAGIQVGSGKDF